MDKSQDSKPEVFWKEKTFILWAIPIIGSMLAVFLDYGYLHYFDIPVMYAEINFYTAALICFYLTIAFISFIFVMMVATTLSNSRHVILRALVQPFPLSICLILYFMATISNQSPILIYVLYFVVVGLTILEAIFNNAKDKTFKDKIDITIMHSKTEVIKTPLGKIYGLVGKIGGFFMLVILLLMSCKYIAKHLDVWVLSTNHSMIAIKRNNDVYILKPFDQKTMVLGQGFKIIKIGEKPLELELMKPQGELKTQSRIEYEKSKKDQELQSEKDAEKDITNIINPIRRYIENIKAWIVGNSPL